MKITAQSQDLSEMIAVFIAGALHSQAGIKLTKEHIEATKDAIKVEIEKLLKVSFIYPMPLTEWVSNPILVNKK